MPEAKAKQSLENVINLLGLLDQLTFSQRGDDGQATWTIRVTPASKR
jgi:hypothetical protein